jgi:hypothetical protein
MTIERALKWFVGLVILFFIARYPNNLVNGIQAFVDAASRVADALSHLHANTTKGITK